MENGFARIPSGWVSGDYLKRYSNETYRSICFSRSSAIIIITRNCHGTRRNKPLRNLKTNLELTKQELQDTQGDRDYYQGQYKKIF